MLIWMLLFLFIAMPSYAATYAAASCNNTAANPDVQTAVTLATNDGDTVTIPAGNCSFTQTVSTTKAIHIIGAGSGSDTGSNTVIQDNVPAATYDRRVFKVRVPCNNNAAHSIKNIRITRGTVDAAAGSGSQATFAIWSGSHAFVMQNIYIDNTDAVAVYLDGDIWGVLSNITIDHASGSKIRNGVLVYHMTWQGTVNDAQVADATCNKYGDKSWATAHTMGTEQAVFIEDSTFYGCLSCSGFSGAVNDMYGGGRLVFRHNTVHEDFIQNHGIEHGRERGGRQVEIYNNIFSDVCSDGCLSVFGYFKSGTGIVTGNTITGYASDVSTQGFALLNSRDQDSHSGIAGSPLWGVCGQPIAWDVNGSTIRTGTAGASSTTDVLSDSGLDWTTLTLTDGITITNTTEPWGSIVTSTTTTTATTKATIYPGFPDYVHNWTSGDSYTVQSAYPCADQIGRGGGTLISGTSPTPTALSQTLEPWYFWNNTRNSVSTNAFAESTSLRVQESRDYYRGTPHPTWTPYCYPHPLAGGACAKRLPPFLLRRAAWEIPYVHNNPMPFGRYVSYP